MINVIPKTLWIVPTRLRADKIRNHAAQMASTMTGAGDVLYAIDGDHDGQHDYGRALRDFRFMECYGPWRGLSGTLNSYGLFWAKHYEQIGFLGDDHFPQTLGWDGYLHKSAGENPYSIAYGSDGHSEGTDGNVPLTYWCMDSKIITLLNQMVPYVLSHTCVDDYIFQLGHQSGSLIYVPEVLVEHRHPLWGKSETDASYEQSSEHNNRLADHKKWEEYQRCQLPHDVRLLELAKVVC